jgi:hypothetical protein
MKTSKDIIIEHYLCEYDQDGDHLCNKDCEPCDSTEVCSYCGNRFVSSERTVETEAGDGPMHSDLCHEVPARVESNRQSHHREAAWMQLLNVP